MGSAKVIHFGYYLRDARTRAGLGLAEFARRVGLSTNRLIHIEKMPQPQIFPHTYARLAQGLGLDVSTLERQWRTTPVPVPTFRLDRTGRSTPPSRPAPSAAVISDTQLLEEAQAALTSKDPERALALLTELHARRAGGGKRPRIAAKKRH